jgi:restriction system protein
MPLPTYDLFIEPVLRYLAQHSQGAPARQVYEAAADTLGLSETERLEVLPSKAQAIYKNRTGWAHDRLKRAVLSSSFRRGFWKLTEKGADYSRSHPHPLTPKEVEDLALSNLNVRLRPRDDITGLISIPESESAQNTQSDVATPDDRLELAVSELRASTADDLLDTIGQDSPRFF